MQSSAVKHWSYKSPPEHFSPVRGSSQVEMSKCEVSKLGQDECMARNKTCLEEFVIYLGKAGKRATEGGH